MGMGLGVGDAPVDQPGVQFVVALEPQPRREEALAHEADLVLDLALLPAGRRRAGDRVDEVMGAHLQEAAIVLPVLADEDRLDRRLHVVVDAARAGALEEGEGRAHARRTPFPGSRADRRARTSSGCGRGGHARPSKSPSRRPSPRSRGSSRTGRLRPAQTTTERRRSPSGWRVRGSSSWRSVGRRRSRPRSPAPAAPRIAGSASDVRAPAPPRSSSASDRSRPSSDRAWGAAESLARRKTTSRPSEEPCEPYCAISSDRGQSP